MDTAGIGRGPRRTWPVHDKQSATNLGIISSHTHQCFGTWSGTFTTDTGERVAFSGIEGWVEDVHNRW